MGRKKHGKGSGGGGALSGLRGGFKGLAGQGKSKGSGGPKSPWDKTLDILLWAAVVAAAGYFFYRRCG